MSLELLVAIAQIAGSVAVVATVVFLAIQVRENTRTSRMTTQQFVNDGWLEVTRMVAADPEIARIYRDGMKDFTALNSDDQWRFGALMQLAFASNQNGFFYGHATELNRDLQRYRLAWLASQNGPRYWWPRAKHLFEPRFQAHVEQVLAEAHPTLSLDQKEPPQ